MNMYTKIVDNGVDAGALMAAKEALCEAPEAARFQWRARSNWVNGTHCYSEVEQFHGLGEEQAHKRCFRFDADHPEIFASEDNGATPVVPSIAQAFHAQAQLKLYMWRGG